MRDAINNGEDGQMEKRRTKSGIETRERDQRDGEEEGGEAAQYAFSHLRRHINSELERNG